MALNEETDEELPPSKSQRKRDAHALQALGTKLALLKPDELALLPLYELLVDALIEARQIKGNGAQARHRQYIGRLMRDVDLDALHAALERLPDAAKARARI